MSRADLPPVTEVHRQAAYALMRWNGTTFAQAMAHPVQGRVIECRAAQLRTQEWERTTQHTVVPVRRVRLGVDGHPVGWCTQMAPGPRVASPQVDFFNQREGKLHP